MVLSPDLLLRFSQPLPIRAGYLWGSGANLIINQQTHVLGETLKCGFPFAPVDRQRVFGRGKDGFTTPLTDARKRKRAEVKTCALFQRFPEPSPGKRNSDYPLLPALPPYLHYAYVKVNIGGADG